MVMITSIPDHERVVFVYPERLRRDPKTVDMRWRWTVNLVGGGGSTRRYKGRKVKG